MNRPLSEIALVFLKLGCTSFGGPAAHIGYFHDECVKRRAWLDAVAFADLVALCQFLPGPGSSQLVYALGRHRAGFAGALLASFCFTLPSALLMLALGLGVAEFGLLADSGWVHGLKLAAVPVVAHAVWTMAQRLCPDLGRRILAVGVAACVLLFSGVWAQVLGIGAGAIAGLFLWRRVEPLSEPGCGLSQRQRVFSAMGLLVFGLLLVGLPLLAATTGWAPLQLWDGFYRSGSLVFGGGHVILPLLRTEVVAPGFLGDDAFLAGYGAAQALPGPLFTFAGYLGAAVELGLPRWLLGVGSLLAVFLPGWLLVGSLLPYWARLRHQAWAQACLTGANAAVVGILLAAFCVPVASQGVRGLGDILIAMACCGLMIFRGLPAWAVVLLCLAWGGLNPLLFGNFFSGVA